MREHDESRSTGSVRMRKSEEFDSYVWVRRDLVQELHVNNGCLPNGWKPSIERGRNHESWQWVKAKLLSTTSSSAPLNQDRRQEKQDMQDSNSPFGERIKLRKVRGSVVTSARTPDTDTNKTYTIVVDDPDASPFLNEQRFSFDVSSDNQIPLLQIANPWWWQKTAPQPPHDLTTLSHLHEPAVVYCLRKRYEQDLIYTYTGRILLALNPCRELESLYGASAAQRYMYQQAATSSSTSDKDKPPHVYATAHDAYSSMIRDTKNQSILVSGESGAGKTVTTKIILGYLTSLSLQNGSPKEAGIEAQVVQSNPILESFGNARTLRNDNSSRFGKFVDVRFNSSSGRLEAACIETYLLEKVRIISPSHGERNYHIFYELLIGLPQRERKDFYLGNSLAQDFRMTAVSGTFDRRDGVDDRKTYRDTRRALSTVGFSTTETNQIFSVCCALLHCSNLTFVELKSGACELDPSSKSLQYALQLLGVSSESCSSALCYSAIEARGEVLLKTLTREKSTKALEALMQAVYIALFQHIVKKINLSIAVRESPRHEGDGDMSIGVLDIFGFESFESNSFEQLCINFCNEALQQQFNHFVFKKEQEEYELEGIEWSFIAFPDNQDVLDLIEKRHTGIISILEEQSLFPRCTDQSFSRAMYEKCANHQRFSVTSSQKIRGRFCIEHYAGVVEYNAATFIEKNKDELPKETTELLTSSCIEFVQALGSMLASMQTSGQNGRNGTLRRSSSSLVRAGVGSQFCGQLRELRQKIEGTAPHYIRCLKPNDMLVPGNFAPSVIADQLRCAGVLEAIRVSRVGFPHRYHHRQFVRRYQLLNREKTARHRHHHGDRDLCEILVGFVLTALFPTFSETRNGTKRLETPRDQSKLEIQVGRTKVFLQLSSFERLEYLRNDVFASSAGTLQKYCRAFLARKQFLLACRCAIILQCFARRLCATRIAARARQKRSATRIQQYWRGYVGERHFVASLFIAQWSQASYRGMAAREIVALVMLEKKIKQIQRAWRRYCATRRWKRQVAATVKLQTLYRDKRPSPPPKDSVEAKDGIEARDSRTLSNRHDCNLTAKTTCPESLVIDTEAADSLGPNDGVEVSLLKDEIESLKLKLARLEGLPDAICTQSGLPHLEHRRSTADPPQSDDGLNQISIGGTLDASPIRQPSHEPHLAGRESPPRSLLDSVESSARNKKPDWALSPLSRHQNTRWVHPSGTSEASFPAEVSAFHRALYRGDAVLSAQILARSDFSLTLVNECNPTGKSPLHMAIASENVVLVNLLLGAGAAANWQDFDGNTPIHLCDTSEIIGVLLEKGRANPNIPNNEGLSVLHMAVSRLDVASVEQLLMHNADVNVADNLEWLTPLHVVAQKIDGGESSDTEARTRIGTLLCGVTSPCKADLDSQDKNGNTPLHHVAVLETEDACDLLRIFLDRGGNPNITNSRGQTALHLLCHNNGLRKLNVMQEMLHDMLYHGANPNLPSRTGCTALHLTLYHRDVDSAVQLINRGAELHLLWRKPKRWSSFWDNMGTMEVLALDMVSDGNALHRLLAAISRPQKWAPNRPWCMHCKAMIGSFTRALHCCHCGRLVCGGCSQRRLDPGLFPVAFEVYESAWVCTVCDGILVSRKQDEDVSTQPNTSIAGEDDITTTISRSSF